MQRAPILALAITSLALLLASPSSFAQSCVASDPTTGNTACGTNVLASATGDGNSGFGLDALSGNTSGSSNTAAGSNALFENTTGTDNTAAGHAALFSNTTGIANTAAGTSALFTNTSGFGNTAAGYEALGTNTTADNNTAIGTYALFSNSTGATNTGSGYEVLYSNTTGSGNTASGDEALYSNTVGHGNVAIGSKAGYSNVNGYADTFVGYSAGANRGSYINGMALGYGATLTASNSIALGNANITKIYAKVTSITAISDRRLKKDIVPLDPVLGLSFIEKLRPVSYRFNNSDETERLGFIAQDLETALPPNLQDKVENAKPEHGLALVERGNDAARTYRVAYGELTAPLVKAVQEQQAEIGALKAENGELRQALAKQAVALTMLERKVGTMKLAENAASTAR